MNKIKYIFIGTLWTAYVLTSITLFPVYNVNVGIPSLALFALTAWLLGVSEALIVLVLIMIYHMFLFDYYGDILETYQAKAFGAVGAPIMVVFIAGSLKQQRDQLKQMSVLLDQKVTERTAELNHLIEQLISDDERLRRSLGQDIHDGLGQNLTGLLLYSSSLHSYFEKNHSIQTEQMEEIIRDAEKSLNLARKISRTLFPFKMIETGFEAALDELTSYFRDTTCVIFEVYLDGSERRLSENTVMHLYRISYESILNAIHNATPSKISIKLLTDNESHYMTIEVDGCDNPENICNNMLVELMRYRAKLIDGTFATQITPTNKINITCRIPSESTLKAHQEETLKYA